MFGKATIEFPNRNGYGTMKVDELSDEVAISYGMVFGRCLSDDDGFVVVRLSDGQHVLFGNETMEGK